MSSVYSDIRAGLENHLNGTVGIPTIAWENVDFKPTTGTPYLKPQFQPTSRFASVKGNNPQRLYQGLYTILCYHPENQGPGASQDVVDTLVARFDDTVSIDYTGDNQVIIQFEYTTAQSPYNSPPWFITPVRVAWFCYN